MVKDVRAYDINSITFFIMYPLNIHFTIDNASD